MASRCRRRAERIASSPPPSSVEGETFWINSALISLLPFGSSCSCIGSSRNSWHCHPFDCFLLIIHFSFCLVFFVWLVWFCLIKQQRCRNSECQVTVGNTATQHSAFMHTMRIEWDRTPEGVVRLANKDWKTVINDEIAMRGEGGGERGDSKQVFVLFFFAWN